MSIMLQRNLLSQTFFDAIGLNNEIVSMIPNIFQNREVQ